MKWFTTLGQVQWALLCKGGAFVEEDLRAMNQEGKWKVIM
jgi:hypothetical protein